MAHGLALAGRLDLDDLGAVVAHHRGEVRAGQEHRQVDDADAFELHGVDPRVR
ncbi:MAG: hypothetical protein R3E48_11235 [Burkholderiaceae bacterium]